MKNLTKKEKDLLAGMLETIFEGVSSNTDGMFIGSEVYRNQKAVAKAIARINEKVLGYTNGNLEW